MPMPPDRPPGPTLRRDFLRLAALAPLAAGCATLGGGAAGPGPRGDPAGPAPAGPTHAASDALAAVRAFPLAPDAEPASVFRAVVARGRGG